MSMDRCGACGRSIDTDVDVECYEGPNPYEALCSLCRDKLISDEPRTHKDGENE